MALTEQMKIAADVGSAGTVVATIMGWIPEATAVLSLIWVGIRIYETRTVQRLLGREP